MTLTVDSFAEQYASAILDGNAAVFAGAGLSIPAGLVDWKGLLKGIAREIGLDVRKEDDLISLAQYHVNSRRGRHRINQQLLDEFGKRASLTDNHRLLTALPIRTYWTTNYDTLIEDALAQAGKLADVKRTVASLARNEHRADATVYKMHGDVSIAEDAVITKDDYESYDEKRSLFSVALQGELVAKTFLFIGFGFSDPNLAYILARIRRLLGVNRRQHFALMRRVQRRDFDSPSLYHYAQAKQGHQVDDLARYGIQGVLVDDYFQYTSALQAVRRRVRLRSVFISGSATTYGSWKAERAEVFLQELSRRLSAKGFQLVSGFGLGVGPLILNGVLDQLAYEGTRRLEGRLVLRPFPLLIRDAAQRKARWTEYRKTMLTDAGVAVFVFGDYPVGGARVPAEGMMEEFALAAASGLFVIPVGATDGTARLLYDRVLSAYADYFPIRGLKGRFRELGSTKDPKVLAQKVVEFAEALPSSH